MKHQIRDLLLIPVFFLPSSSSFFFLVTFYDHLAVFSPARVPSALGSVISFIIPCPQFLFFFFWIFFSFIFALPTTTTNTIAGLIIDSNKDIDLCLCVIYNTHTHTPKYIYTYILIGKLGRSEEVSLGSLRETGNSSNSTSTDTT